MRLDCFLAGRSDSSNANRLRDNQPDEVSVNGVCTARGGNQCHTRVSNGWLLPEYSYSRMQCLDERANSKVQVEPKQAYVFVDGIPNGECFIPLLLDTEPFARELGL